MLCNPQLYGVPIDALDTDPLMQVSCWSSLACAAEAAFPTVCLPALPPALSCPRHPTALTTTHHPLPPTQERRLDLAHSAAVILDRNNLVKYDRRSGSLQATDLGRIASQVRLARWRREAVLGCRAGASACCSRALPCH